MAYHCHFHDHSRVDRELIAKRADEFFLALEKDFGKVILDEVCVLEKLPKNQNYTLVSGHSMEPKRRATDCNEEKVVREIEKEMADTLKKGLLADGEGFFDMRRNISNAFDAMTRIGNTYVCFNNTSTCIQDLEAEYGISRNRMLSHIRNFVNLFKTGE